MSGYASIVNGNYETMTHTHEQDDLDIGQLSSGTLDRLDLRELVTVPEYFLVPLQSLPQSFGDFTQIPEGFGADPVLSWGYGANFNETAYPFIPGPRPALGTGHTASWFFGEALEPDTATLVLGHPATSGTLVRFGALSADGTTRWGAPVAVPTGASSVTDSGRIGPAVGLSIQVLAGSLPSQRAVITVAGRPYELAGSLSSAVVPGPWQLAGFSQGYAVFTLRKPAEPVVASTATGRSLPVHVISSTTKSEQIQLQAPVAATVIRSVAWDSGWSATVSVNGGEAHAIPVNDFDLVQQVHLPAGNDVVTFRYRPRHLLLASLLSLGALALLLVLLAAWLVRGHRRRHRPSSPEPDSPPVPEVAAVGVPERVG